MAKITTITNPLTGQPAQVDQLDHTAQQIDDAIARALPGGAIDITLQNNDPRNWGLGNNLPVVDANYIDGTMFFQSNTNMPTAQMWIGYQIKRIDGDVIRKEQFAFRTGAALPEMAVRKYTGENGWTPWEYVNPPMQLSGVDADGNVINEYRTTERYLGKPVYTRVFNCGAVPSNGQRDFPMGISDYIIKIRCDAFAVGKNDVFTIPRKVNNAEVTVTLASYGNKIFITSNTDTLSNYDVYVIAYYTKPNE